MADVWRKGEPKRGIRAALAAVLLTAAGSANPAGPSDVLERLDSETADPQIRKLVRRAAKGDRSARLELGLRLQEGRGLPRDPGGACALFSSRPSARNREVWLYTPSTRSVQRYERETGPATPVDEELEYRAFLCRQGAKPQALKP